MWVEKHGNRFRVLDRDGGKKYTVRTFETEAEALMFAGVQRSPVEGFSFIPMRQRPLPRVFRGGGR